MKQQWFLVAGALFLLAACSNVPQLMATPTPELTPVTYRGSGDGIVNVEWPERTSALLHIVGNACKEYFAVAAYDKNGENEDLLVMTALQPYDGVRPFRWHVGYYESARLKILSTCDWSIEVRPIDSMRRLTVPGSLSGIGDEMIRLEGAPADSVKLQTQGEGATQLWAYPKTTLPGLLVNTRSPYTGVEILPAETFALELEAWNEWSIEVAPK